MRRFTALTSLCLLAACAPVETFYKPGAEVARLQQDQLGCETRALRDAPVANQVRQDPPVYVPPRRTCDSAGNCTSYGGYWRAGQIYSVDVNRDLRGRLLQACMAERGYTRVQIPRCEAGLGASGQMRVLPELTAQSCAIVGGDGRFVIVDAPS